MLRRVSSTISKSGVPRVTLASRPSPNPSSLVLSPPSPTTPASLPGGVDTDSNAIKFSEVELGVILRPSASFNDLSPLPFSGAPAEPTMELSFCREPVSLSLSLPGHSESPLPCGAPPSLTTGCSTSGYTLDAATRLQDFRALIDELRATLLHHHDSREEFDTGNYEGDNDERERLLRLLEDVMRKVQQLTEHDPPPAPWRPRSSVTMTTAAP